MTPRLSTPAYGFFLVLLLLTAGACTSARRTARAPEPIPELPAIPAQDGLLRIDVAYPPPDAARPDADSTFIFGTVGTGRARLTINGLRIPVAPNGAFLAYVPVPADGTYRLVARAGDRTDTATRAYRQPAPPVRNVSRFAAPRTGVVAGGRDTLATGSQIASGAPSPGADRRWFFPRGTRLTVVGRLGGLYLVRLTNATEAWVDTAEVRLGPPADVAPRPVGPLTFQPAERYVDLRLAVDFAPFHVEAGTDTVALTLYGRAAPGAAPAAPSTGGLIESLRWEAAAADSARLVLRLGRPMWGYKAFYDTTGTLVFRLRRPPPIDPQQPLRGIRVMVDAGHPPGGAIGPTGLTEAEANLAVSLRLAELLRERGADVVMTRTSPEPLVSATDAAQELWARVDLAVAEEADLLVSVHNNAFADGVDPFAHYGTEAYYYHSFSRPLAEALVREIVPVTGLPDLGAKARSLALVRPTWMPSTLTESLFMMFPQQEVALRTPAFVERLAAAHLRGIEAFLRQAE